MPATTIPSIPHYVPAPPTSENCKLLFAFCCDLLWLTSVGPVVEWADLPLIDISKAATPEGRAELAPRVRDAMRTKGFIYIINHGYTESQVWFPHVECELAC